MAEETLLDPSIETHPEGFDHPVDLTESEVLDGLRMWEAIDDLDDDDDGITPAGLRTASPGYAEARRRADIVRMCLLEAGVPEVSIEIVDGRPDYGDTWNLCRPVSVISHHIASTPSPSNPTPGLSLVKRGRSDLPGPLCNGTAGVDLVYRIVCMGMANHPGEGGPWTVSGPLGSYTIPRDVARPYAWGTEYEGGYTDEVWDAVYTNRRTGKSMTFREFMGRCNAGLTRAIWLINGRGQEPGAAGERDLSGYHGEHATWTSRKIDRRNYSTDRGREEIRKYNEGDDVSAKDVWEFKIKPLAKGAKEMPARMMLAQAHNRALDARKNSWVANTNATRALEVGRVNRDLLLSLAEDASPNVKARALAMADDINLTPVTEADVPDEVEES